MPTKPKPNPRPLTADGKYLLGDLRDLDMFREPDRWPLMVLPLKRSTATGHGFPELAVLAYSPEHAGTDKAFWLFSGPDINLNMPTTWTGRAPDATYSRESLHDLLSAGWRVD